MFKIISNKLYEEYTKEVIGYHQNPLYITREQLYDIFKFHCQGVRVHSEVVDYIYNLIQQDKSDRCKYESLIATKDNEIEQLNQELLQLNGTCFKYKKDNKSLRGTIKSILETSGNRHNEIKRLLAKIETLEKSKNE